MITKYNKFIIESVGIRDEYTKMGVKKYYTDNKETYVNPHEGNIKLVLDWVLKQINITDFIDLSCGNGEVTSYLAKKGITDAIGTDPYFNEIYTEKTRNECLKLSFEDIAIAGLNVHKQTIICSYALHLCPDSYFSQLMYNLSLNCTYFVLISPSKYPTITEDYFELIDETIINRTHCKIYKSKNSLNEKNNSKELKNMLSLTELRQKYPYIKFTMDSSPKFKGSFFARVDIEKNNGELKYLGALKGPVSEIHALEFFNNTVKKYKKEK